MILRRLPRLVNTLTADELCIPDSLTSNAAKRLNKSTTIILFALVKSKRLLVQVSEQMKRFNVYICSFNRSLEQAPKVFQTVRVNVPFRVALRVIDHIVDIFVRKLVVG